MDKAARAALLTAKGIKKKRSGFDQGGTQKIEYGSKTGFPELDRIITGLGNINQMFNPVESIGNSMQASQRMMAPETQGWDRVTAFGDMLSNAAGVVAPAVVATRAGVPATTAVMESLLGGSPTNAVNVASTNSGTQSLTAAAPQNDFYKLLTGQAAEVPPQSLSPPPSVISIEGPSLRTVPSQPYNQLGPRAGTGPARPSDPKAEALGFKDTVYHASDSPTPFTQFDLDRNLGTANDRRYFQDYLGAHVGTAKAAGNRYEALSQGAISGGRDPSGFTMELRARTDTPLTKADFGHIAGYGDEAYKMFGNRVNSPITENDLDLMHIKYGNYLLQKNPSLADQYGRIAPEVVAQHFRRDLAERGYTHIPYVNSVEDAGNMSNIMLVDRPQGSPAVLRDVRAEFDPNKISDPDLRFYDGGRVGKSTGGAMEFARHVEAVNRAGGQIAPSKYLPDVPRAVHADGGRENGDNGHIYVVHGGSDFDQIDKSYSGRGEPGNIRPLGNGLYGDVIDHTDPELAARSIEGAKHYARKYGRGEKTIHVFKVPKSSSTVFNGHREVNVENYPKPIEGLGLEPTEELNAYRAHEATQPPYDPENSADYWEHSRKSTALWNAVKNAADLRMQHLPIGVTEVAIQNPKVATRIGKFSLDTPTSDILDAVKDDANTRANGGRIHANGGGKMELRSKAAEVISGLKGEKGLAEDMIRAAKNAGVKDVEIANANPPSGKISRDELARHFENAVPKVQVKRIGDAEKAAELKKQHSGQRDIEGMTDDEIDGMVDHALGVHEPLYEQYQLPYGKNYREHILSLPDDRGEKNFYSTHWDSPNVLAHVRLSDRYKGETQKNIEPIIGKLAQYFETSLDYLGPSSADHAVKKGVISPDEAATVSRFMRWKNGYETQKGVGRKILHVEELQSDWNSTARKEGLKTGREKQEYDDYVAGMRQKMIDKVTRPQAPVFDPETGEDKPPIPQDVIDKKVEKYQKMHPSDLAAYLGVSDEHRQMDLARYKGVYPAPYIDPDSRDVENLALKHVLTEAAKGGYDGITFTPGSEQSARWGNTDFGDIYDRILPNMTTKLARQHDKTITPDVMGLPSARGNTVSAQLIPLTDTARQSILKNGFGAFKRGGTVGKEEGGATGSLREKALWPSAQAIKAGTGSREAHAEMVNKIKPVSPYDAPVSPASDQQVHDALSKDKQPKAFAPRGLKEGTPVAVRLDIPAYEKKNTWVVSVHHPKTDFTAGEVIGYDSVAHIGNPRFGVHPTGALNIASGKPKSTIATVHGNWKKTTPEDALRLSQTIHNDPQWRQVGMDPERHSYFYDRETQEPVMAADEALHIGPLVYAKNPVYGKKTDFAFSKGGDVEGDDGITAYHSSPHDFDQFDVSKLGTGEGNQSYGPGLYFAENPKVSDRGGQYWNQFMNRGKMTPEKKAAFALQMSGWDRDKAVDRLQKRMEDHIDRAIPGKYGNGPVDEEGNRLLAQETQEAIDHVRSGKILGPRTYKVKINAKPHELIDWDEPLSEQHPNIQAVLGSSHETAGSKLSRVNRNPNYRGDILGKETATLQELYDHFRSKGIKGIRYNDAGSRHGPNGDGTKNYVMFHHDPVQIVDKYEYGGTVGKEEGGAMGDDNVVNLGFRRTMNAAMSDAPPQHVQDMLTRVSDRYEASKQAYTAAKADGVFDALPFGDKYRYKPTPNSTPMEVVGHRMMHVSRWGGKEPPKLVYQDHYPVVDMEPVGQPAYTRPYPVEHLLGNPDLYQHISGKPRLVKRKGGAVDDALALTRRFSKDGAGATMALKPKGK